MRNWIILIGFALTIAALAWPHQTQDTMIGDDAVGVLAQRNSTNTQRASWANTYTSSTNYAWRSMTNQGRYVDMVTCRAGNRQWPARADGWCYMEDRPK